MTQVRFRLVYLVDLFTMTEGSLQFECGSQIGTVQIELRRLRGGDIETLDTVPNDTTQVVCVASCETQPDQRIISALEDIEAHRLPPGGMVPQRDRDLINSDGTVKPSAGIPLGWTPSWLQDFRHNVHRELEKCALRTLKIARWYCDAHGGHRAYQSERWLLWSWADGPWRVMPPHIIGKGGRRVNDLPLTTQTQNAVRELVANPHVEEPLGHELFREAWNQQRSNPRSALIIGISAIESGMKEFISDVEPGASWLVQEVQSPPLYKMVKEYLPWLIQRHQLMPPFAPSKEIRRRLREGVELRNKVVHGVNEPLDSDTLEEILLAIRDTLWMLDVYRGHDWARRHVRPTTLASWEPDSN